MQLQKEHGVHSFTDTTTEAEAELDETVRASLSLDEETLKRGQVTADFSKKKDVIEMYNKMWDKIKEVQ